MALNRDPVERRWIETISTSPPTVLNARLRVHGPHSEVRVLHKDSRDLPSVRHQALPVPIEAEHPEGVETQEEHAARSADIGNSYEPLMLP